MIQQLIDNKQIEIFFQPIVSIKDKRIFAFEALTRAYDENKALIYPMYIFEQAKKENLSNVLDRYVRELAIKKFQQFHKEDKRILLFLNFESSIIDSEESDNLVEIVKEHNINPSNIAIEIKEDSVKDNNSLVKFVSTYRQMGFIIAIDDFGTGYSSFDRLALIKPDIVKVDRSIIYDINNNFINSEILKAISNMCHKIGAIVLAEGVESKNEVLSCLKKDIDIFQGFYFSKPKKSINQQTKETIFTLINNIGSEYKGIVKKHMIKKEQILKESQSLTKDVLSILVKQKSDSIEKLKEIIFKNEKLEAIYLINLELGIQVGDTIINNEENTLFSPTKDSHDHNLKEYFFIAKESSRGDYLSGKYISKASGHMCRTYSKKIELNGKNKIICLDVIL
ncbi:MAG: EAL domain-containing protein [Campylobacterota bacterium]|nr:EAL domain-containing protein [Campylobacterota bacterium]